MNNNQSSKTTIITIGRKFGSGGRVIGKLVAEKLNIPFFDKEIMIEAAKKSGLCDKFVESIDERPTNSLLYSLVMNGQTALYSYSKPIELVAYEAQFEAVRSAAAGGSCVIVGRGADYILSDDYDVFSVFITASDKYRSANVAKREGISEKEAMQKVRRLDKSRAAFYNCLSDKRWGSADTYDLCFNSEQLSEEDAAELIIKFLEHRVGK
ncbi:MAG: AAA family ATPase [Oscillospiraceae bacterium]